MNKLWTPLTLIAFALLFAKCSPENDVIPVSSFTTSDQTTTVGAETFTALFGGTVVGQMEIARDDVTRVGYEYRNNGRGPSIEEVVEFGDDGFPEKWVVTGATTFGNRVDERFQIDAGRAIWTDSTGSSEVALEDARLYVSQAASPYALWIYSRLLLATDELTLPVLPAGELRLEAIESFEVSGDAGQEMITTYALSGIDLNPSYLALDESNNLFASIDPGFALIREGFENVEEQLRDLSAEYAARRFETIQERVTHTLDYPLRINNIRIFNPANQELSALSSLLVEGDRIAAIEPPVADATNDELYIDGAGGTLIAGMYEMHGHAGQGGNLLNIAAGVTSIRDMGNDNEVLSDMIEKIQSGRLVGPRITRSGFIEGQSPFSANLGFVVATQEEAVDAVRQYSNGDFHQIKIYNSMNPEWVPAIVAEAKANGLRVAGHIPAFSNADAMIAAGYDELTHINQVMLGWVLEPEEDTRTLLRFTAMQRFPELGMSDTNVQNTLTAMVERGIAIDPTLVIHERGLTGRNGDVYQGMIDVVDHLPIGQQRTAKTAMFEVATDDDDRAYRLAYDKIVETLVEMRRLGILLVPGTDLGGSFYYHRELELYQQLGMTPSEIVKLATYDMAEYLGQEVELGSIEPGKLADFFLIPGDPTTDIKAITTISLVAKDGAIYFPSEIYPEFGIRPFLDVPEIIYPD